jgi:hypothetical protein
MDDRLANLEQTMVEIIKDFRAAEAGGTEGGAKDAGGNGTASGSFRGEPGV